ALHCASGEETRPQRLVRRGRNENDRDVALSTCELALHVEARHAGHRDVQNETTRLVEDWRGEEFETGREGPRLETDLAYQVGQRFAHRLVVVDDCNERTRRDHRILALAFRHVRGLLKM